MSVDEPKAELEELEGVELEEQLLQSTTNALLLWCMFQVLATLLEICYRVHVGVMIPSCFELFGIFFGLRSRGTTCNYPQGVYWEVVSLTASAYVVAPARNIPKFKHEEKGDVFDKDKDETSNTKTFVISKEGGDWHYFINVVDNHLLMMASEKYILRYVASILRESIL
ncbi:hypothetical protein Tco_0722100 [Tanacetum coccineum]